MNVSRPPRAHGRAWPLAAFPVLLLLLLPGSSLSAQTTAPIRGDVTRDGRVTVADVLAVLAHAVGRELPATFDVRLGDNDGDGRVSAADAVLGLAHAVGRDVSRYGIGQVIGRPSAVVEVTISGIGSPSQQAAAAAPSHAAAGQGAAASGRSGPRQTSTLPSGGGDGTMDLTLLSTGSFTEGARGAGGVRYVWATFRVKNQDADGAVYGTHRRNLTFFGVDTDGTAGVSPVSRVNRFDGTAITDLAMASRIVPTGAVQQVNGERVSAQPDVLQLIEEGEADAFPAVTGVHDVFPYGFVVRAADGGRTLPASPATGWDQGVVTFAFAVPLQATPQEDAYTVSLLFLPVDDDVTRITQSAEEQASGGGAFEARAAEIGATQVTLLPGSTSDVGTRTLCGVRTAGPQGSATSTLSPCPGVGSVVVSPAAVELAVGATQQMSATVIDTAGHVVAAPRVTWISADESVATVSASGLVTVTGEGLATISAMSEGVRSTATVTGEPVLPETLTGGAGHTCGLTASGAAYCWGRNDSGQLGNGTASGSSTPVAVAGGHVFVQISGGESHTVGLTAGGRAYAWGGNAQGQLGDGTTTGSTRPVAVSGGLTFSRVAAGGSHSVALTSTGVAHTWGRNAEGQLGIGTTTASTTPVAVSGGHTLRQISAGLNHTVAINSLGAVYAWGANAEGQLGNGGTTGSLAPVAVSGGHVFAQVSAGAHHTVALSTADAAYAWGRNTEGQLGNGSTAGSATPVAVSGGHAYVEISAGAYHTLALTSAGAAHGWGYNAEGQLGDGGAANATTPTAAAGGHTFERIGAGRHHSVARTVTGTVYAWGNNRYAQLGNGGTTSSSTPAPVSSFSLEPVSTVEISPASATQLVGRDQQLTATLRSAAGTVLTDRPTTWSSSDPAVATVSASGLVTITGEGTATITARSEGRSGTATVTGERILPETITAGVWHSCALTESGAAYCWGYGEYGQLGHGSTTGPEHCDTYYACSTTPVAVVMPGGVTFSRISAGDYHTVALSGTGTAYAWGLNDRGQLGDGGTTNRAVPVAVAGGRSFADVSAGWQHTAALTTTGAAYAWGSNAAGQLGNGGTADSSTPVAVLVPGGVSFQQVGAGREHTLALSTTGAAYAWGSNQHGQLGDGSTTNRTTPVAVAGGHTFTQLRAGAQHSLALTGPGAAYAWGYNYSGQLGDGGTADRSTPEAVVMPGGATFRQIGGGSSHTVALTATGAAYAWGANFAGQLGTGGTTSSTTPVAVVLPGGATFRQIGGGNSHTVALTTTGAAYAWGYNLYGQLGNGGTASSSTPTPVSGGLTFR